MKKSFVFVALAAVIAMCATSCKKDESVLKFTATIERGSGKTTLAGWADEARQVVWSEGDKIKVFGGELETYANLGYICKLTRGSGSTSAEFVVDDPDNPNVDNLAASSSFTAVYPVDAWYSDAHVYINANQTFRPGNVLHYPMVAKSSNTHLEFKNVCGIIEVKLPYVENISLSGMKIIADHQISGDYQVTWDADGNPVLSYCSFGNTFDEIEVSFPGAIDLSDNERPSVYVYLPAGPVNNNHSGIKIEFYTTDNYYTQITASANQPINVRRSEITTLDFSSATIPPAQWHPVPIQRHYFSVSPTLQVDIAHGNLIHGTGGNWFIAQNPWDVYGNFDYFTDLFYWSGADNRGGLSQVDEDDIADFSFYDWGNLVNSNTSTSWRSLTADEWEYLTNSGNHENSVRANKAYYVYITDMHYTDEHRSRCNLGGILLMPDDWNHADDPSEYDDMDDNFRECGLSKEEFLGFIEKGCAFIPTTGYTVRDEPIEVSDLNQVWMGYYLLAYPNCLAFHAVDCTHESVYFNNINWTFEALVGGDLASLNQRYAVRLVRNAMHRNTSNDDWEYYGGFGPSGAKGKRK